jgi:hypothetical protein
MRQMASHPDATPPRPPTCVEQNEDIMSTIGIPIHLFFPTYFQDVKWLAAQCHENNPRCNPGTPGVSKLPSGTCICSNQTNYFAKAAH